MPTERRIKQLREEDVVRRALETLGGEQSVTAICAWIQQNAPELHDEQRIEKLLRSHPTSQHLVLGPETLERTTQEKFKLVISKRHSRTTDSL